MLQLSAQAAGWSAGSLLLSEAQSTEPCSGDGTSPKQQAQQAPLTQGPQTSLIQHGANGRVSLQQYSPGMARLEGQKGCQTFLEGNSEV